MVKIFEPSALGDIPPRLREVFAGTEVVCVPLVAKDRAVGLVVADRRVVVDVDLEPDLPQVLADGHQLQRVFLNLWQNALQAMEDTRAAGEAILGVRTWRDGDTVKVAPTRAPVFPLKPSRTSSRPSSPRNAGAPDWGWQW